jgi:hypothetical protein
MPALGCGGAGRRRGGWRQAPATHLVVHAPVDALDAIATAGRDQWGGIFAEHHWRLIDGWRRGDAAACETV